jgi:A/G-specific adenine glycosylase
MQRRGKGDIWQGLYEFPIIEDSYLLNPEALTTSGFWQDNIHRLLPVLSSNYEDFVHQLTHQQLHTRFFIIQLQNVNPDMLNPDWTWVSVNNLHKYPISRLTEKFLNNYLMK